MIWGFSVVLWTDCIYIEQSKHNAVIMGAMKYTFCIIINNRAEKCVFCIRCEKVKHKKFLWKILCFKKQIFSYLRRFLPWNHPFLQETLNSREIRKPSSSANVGEMILISSNFYLRCVVVATKSFIMCGFILTLFDFKRFFHTHKKTWRVVRKSKMLPNES